MYYFSGLKKPPEKKLTPFGHCRTMKMPPKTPLQQVPRDFDDPLWTMSQELTENVPGVYRVFVILPAPVVPFETEKFDPSDEEPEPKIDLHPCFAVEYNSAPIKALTNGTEPSTSDDDHQEPTTTDLCARADGFYLPEEYRLVQMPDHSSQTDGTRIHESREASTIMNLYAESNNYFFPDHQHVYVPDGARKMHQFTHNLEGPALATFHARSGGLFVPAGFRLVHTSRTLESGNSDNGEAGPCELQHGSENGAAKDQ